ncbi:MAG: PEP-CTERM sorting domain-containing protein, partial [Sphingomonadaceae bacterium]
PAMNSWTVTSGAITSYNFVVYGSSNSAPAVTCCTLFLVSLATNGAALFDDPNGGFFSGDPKDIVFRRVTTVPEPASALLFGSALAVAALLRRRTTIG